MSHLSDLTVGPPSEFSPFQIVTLLSNAGWEFFRDGKVTHLPLGDKDDFNWQDSAISFSDFLKILSKKKDASELIGFVMFYGKSNVGCEVLFHSAGSINFSFSINRVLLGGNRNVTDFSFYSLRILKPMIENGIDIEKATFTDAY